jgi:hypothetical protein
VSISPTFYEQLFCTKVFYEAFVCQFGFVIVCRKNIGTKAAHKILLISTTDMRKSVGVVTATGWKILFLTLLCQCQWQATFAESQAEVAIDGPG